VSANVSLYISSTGARAKAWCLLIHAEASLSLSSMFRAISTRPWKAVSLRAWEPWAGFMMGPKTTKRQIWLCKAAVWLWCLGGAVQVEMKPTLKAPVPKLSKLTSDKMLSTFAFKFNLRRYT